MKVAGKQLAFRGISGAVLLAVPSVLSALVWAGVHSRPAAVKHALA